MIKFFRKIRQRLLTENKFSKYLLYAIGEVFLVVIGIMIALQANNWNQSRKQLDNEVQMHSKLYDDLNSEYLKIERNSRQFGYYSRVFSHTYSETKGEAEYNPDLNYDYFLWFHRYHMFINEKYSESLSSITNDKIHEKLKVFINVEKQTNDAINEWNEHQLKEVRPYLSRHGINKTKAMFNKELDGFASIINETDLIEYSKLKEQYGSIEFDQLLFTIQFKTTWVIQNLVWLNETNLRIQDVLKKELELHGVTENITYWEKEKKYKHLINEAGAFYDTKEYQKSAMKYKEVFKLTEGVYNRDRYNAACSFALADDRESAFIQLFFLANNSSNYLRIDKLFSDVDLENLHEDQRWNELIAIVKSNKKEKEE